ncbi:MULTISPECIES: sulfite exporter TauE/SafE family protein [Halomonadaceae]|uniref:sulfite exporter TauE/SafE family protein n=1 Tax=Halomonadaceae TaxID=28256 RepID=UPI0015991A72|nr:MULTISPECIES: sulfite exporter TauE/SafE family protein [Halomonas]QJQ94842.1 sulfite exporter TauE/SafE family protein [Halomonas sp. PA5]
MNEGDFLSFVLIAVTTCIAAFIQGIVGIGFALILAPVMGLLRPDLLPVSLLLLMLPLNLYVAARERNDIDWKGVVYISVGRVPGTVLGLLVLSLVSARGLNQLVGGVTVLAVLSAFLLPPFHPRRGECAGAGFITGISETATGVGGPPMALLYQHKPGSVLRSTIATCFLIGEVFSLIILVAVGFFYAYQLLWVAALLPALAIGGLASRFMHYRLDAWLMRTGVLLFSLGSGAYLLFK